MKKKCVFKALTVLVFAAYLCAAGFYDNLEEAYGETAYDSGKNISETDASAGFASAAAEPEPIRDLTQAFDVILTGADREFIAGYTLDRSFLMWLDAQYGDQAVIEVAGRVQDGDLDPDVWYDATGNSIHVLWLLFCRSNGFQNYRLEHVVWKECRNTEEIVLSFAGDFNFAENWHTTEYMEQQPRGIYDCFSSELLEEMNDSDIMVMNNEFVYTRRGTPLAGKDYTFRADPSMTELLSVFGTDLVTLANNHIFDYGETGLLDTMHYLNQAEIPYLGAGKNISEASNIMYFVANGRKIAIVSATEIERTKKFTREATETDPGVFKTLEPEKFVRVIEQAKESSDYVIAVVHWGTEGALRYDGSQAKLAWKFAQAGLDAVIGGHPHRLQGAGFIGEVPVAYSLGNFWFSNGTLYTTLTQIIISKDGSLQMKYLPCIQKNLTTSLITEPEEKDEFYQYLAAISKDIGIDEAGYVYNKNAKGYSAAVIRYDSDKSRTKISGVKDNEGNVIDIVGNLK